MKRYSEKKYIIEVEIEDVEGVKAIYKTNNITSSLMEEIISVAEKTKADKNGEIVNNAKNSKIVKEIFSLLFGGQPQDYNKYNFFMLTDIWKDVLGELHTIKQGV